MRNYKNIIIIDKEYEDNFKENKKEEISEIEYYGLEKLLKDIYNSYRFDMGNQVENNIEDYFIFRNNYLKVLDGIKDYIMIDNHLITKVFITKNGVAFAECYHTEKDLINDKDVYFIRLN